MRLSKIGVLVKEVFDEYKKAAIALLVQLVSITVIFNWLVSYFYLKDYTLPRSLVVVSILLILWFGIIYRRTYRELKSYKHPKLTEDQEYILSMHKDLPLGNGQCASTLLGGQAEAHIQEAQYHLDVLNELNLIEIINRLDLDEEEPLYRLTKLGRKYLYENNVLYKQWGA
ncbi:hypothetical protein GNX18_02725 [Microbulbifer sp. SH-1]|uniref:hypothetical protein n=1 Tax=Microbulbifer sp. SH-1 TaxID=2681547 RepID=UPI0014073946|nr:hypothetical protein [Microbulbifer sp. SH-1]QIL88799.1 hypothetical protein GNX18_02725 [Microbulbifer sp. SH-1]